MRLVVIAALSYLIGSFSSAYVVGKLFMKIDIRKHGSGNAGATNAVRIMGKKLGVLTFLMDFTKGIIAVLIGIYLHNGFGGYISALFAVIGHNWPVFLNFKGGKGIATTIAAMAVLSFPTTLLSVVIGILTAVITKYVSLGSIVFLSLLFLLTSMGVFVKDPYLTALTAVLAILGYYRHRENIKRLLAGNENRIGR
ncbi:glycerol-3-phosphate 1-O-acyltransferase PlsY [Gudongella oleilytica]|jgi:glycerol-3-phosphate acyltransferase PlsY|uniref:glycerol-3-phosphate 1-O-acyltransferase PlsY n=1 Tax=Gudongella oleilytica TaxID=1582259 RepID=UPI000EE759FB|nr:glycerol-3-phosphate 1-O-acyltransferase PlsY [Gudongella oleilytica]MDY0256937.1 glycerol-3-phosphate 1-O-acyltransferase PlsY [Gudongella oleilytica]HCO19136.1 acyl-phosphate glycerol 3-phosphate acyltransferase [Tissierellales bacterium]